MDQAIQFQTPNNLLNGILSCIDMTIQAAGDVDLPEAWHGRFFQRGSLHGHLLYGLTEGAMDVHLSKGSCRRFEEGMSAWFQPGVACHFTIPDEIENTHVYFLRFHFPETILRLYTPVIFSQRHDVLRDIQKLVRSFRAHQMIMEPFQRAGLVTLLHQLIASHPATDLTPDSGLTHPQQEQCLAFIRANIHRFFAMEELARHCDLSAAYLTTQFRKTYGMTPQTYIKRERIRRAQTLLSETALRTTEVVTRLGYNTSPYFCHQFKSVTGMTPKEWRRSQRYA